MTHSGTGARCVGLVFGMMVGGAAASAEIDIAIVADGDSALATQTSMLLREELQALGDRDFEFRFPPHRQVTHDWDPSAARAAIEAALSDPAIEIVIALDIISSSVVADFEPTKPLLASTVVQPALQGFPVTEAGTSGLPGVHFLTANFDFPAAIRRFQQATGARHVGLLVDGDVFSAIPALTASVRAAQAELDLELSLISGSDSVADPWLAAIPAGVDALFLTPLPKLDAGQTQRLIDHAKERRWPTFTTLGRDAVQAGFLMGRSLVTPPEQLARRLAVDIRDIALGRAAEDLAVTLGVQDRLAINRLTAEAIGFEPTFELIFSADILNEELPTGRVLTLGSAIGEAVERNLQLAVADRDLEVAREDTRIARGTLLPQLGGDVSLSNQDRDLAGTGPTRTTEVGLGLSQSLYSESRWSDFQATAFLEAASVADLKSTRLDVIETAALTYLAVLIAKTERDIQVENLNLTRANLERARFRYDVGSTDRSEVFRFETELGTDQQSVTNALAAFERQRFELNRVLQQPISLPFQLDEPGIEAARIFGDPRLARFLDGPVGVASLADFLAKESLARAPELESLRTRILAQERRLLAAERQRYVPDVDAFARVSEIVDDGGARFDTDFDEDWSVGVEATWSLFEGGAIRAERRRAAALVDQLELTLQQQADFIEADARASLAQAAASRLNIGFAASSADAARSTLDLVTDSYVRGASSYIDLIDAQNAFLSARLAAANAVYQHLQDLVALQRDIAFFDFAVSPTEKEAWFERLDDHATAGQESR
ncbi:MAG: TolC family protein [Pseudomonadota bacterium]